MKRKILFVIFACVLFVSVCCCIFACNGGSLSEPAVRFSLTDDGKARIEWDRIGGASGYRIYKSPSRYGTYVAVSADKQTDNYYVTDDVYAYYRIRAEKSNGEEIRIIGPVSYDIEVFGSNVYVYAPTDREDRIRSDFKTKYSELENGEFSGTRFAAFFKAGTYSTVSVEAGYYTTVAGLGINPTDVTVGGLNVKRKNALTNFWRGAENLTVGGDVIWSVSQATSLRKIKINGNLTLSYAGSASSGGFLADSYVTGTVNSGSQQQWLSRDTKWGGWNGGLWNMCFAGIDGNTPSYASFSKITPYTVFDNTETVREKPYLTFTETDGYRVFVPSLHENHSGITWADGLNGEYIPLTDFYVARSDRDDADTINAALSQGKHLMLTAGVYEIDKPISVTNPNTIVYGVGLATLKVTDFNADTLMRVADVDGVKICGVLFDAGRDSQSLLEIGEENSSANHSENPVCLSDLFFRVGGAVSESVSADVCVIINSNDVLGDNFWVWRADHSYGVAWDKNVCRNGIIVNGDNVLFYGLFVEHFLEYQTVWNGENGTTYFYQSELPYDPPCQEEWTSHDGTVNGYSSYKVGDGVTVHNAYALGIYSYLRDGAVKLENAIETQLVSGIRLEHVITVYLAGNKESGIEHVINGVGDAVSVNNGQARIESYSGG